MKWGVAALGLAISAVAVPARADPPEPITKPIEIKHDLKLDLPALGALAVVTVGFRLMRDNLEPSHCRICDGPEGKDVNAIDQWFRDALRQRDIIPANYTSYILAFGMAPLAGAGLTILAAAMDNRMDEAVVDVVAVAEGGFTSMLTTEILESLTLRERPYVHAMADADERNAEIAKTGAFHSFPAGHVVEAFGTATAAGVVASMRGYRLAPVVWIVGMAIGAATAYTRMAADRHYFTDTLAGAAIGTVTGGAVPLIFHGRKQEKMPTLMALPTQGGVMLGAGWNL